MFIIYCIFNTINGKVYIGKTNNLHRRWNEHKRISNNKMSKYFSLIHSSIAKYGIDNFELYTLQSFFLEEDAYKSEMYWINFYNSRNSKYGYNITIGGMGSGSGKTSPNFGLKRSQETINKLKESHLGSKNQNYQKDFSLETRKRMSKNNAMKKEEFLGENHPTAKLTNDIVTNLKKDWNSGLFSKKYLSEKYNIKYINTVNILNGYTWKHIIV